MSFIPMRVSVGTISSVTGTTGTGAAGRVAYWSGAAELTSDSAFTFDGTTMSAKALIARNDTNGATRIQIRNDDAGASAFTQLKLTTDAGDINLTANSAAAGDSVSLTADSTFGGGMDLGILGANALRLRTAGTAWLTISGTGPSTFAANVTVESSAGPQVTIKDGGTIGTNADPFYQLNDTNGLVGALGFLVSNSKNMSVANYTDTGSVYISANGAAGIEVSSAQLVTIGAAGGTQIHRINGDTGTAGAVSTYLKLNVNGTEYRVPLHATA